MEARQPAASQAEEFKFALCIEEPDPGSDHKYRERIDQFRIQGLQLVLDKSDIGRRRCAARMADNLKMECKPRFSPFDVDHRNPLQIIYLFCEFDAGASMFCETAIYRIFGGVSFLLGDKSKARESILHWAWIHPHYRNKGHLTTMWPEFQRVFGRRFQVGSYNAGLFAHGNPVVRHIKKKYHNPHKKPPTKQKRIIH